MDFDWSVIWQALPELLKGARLTVLIALAGLAGGLVIGFAAGLARAYGNIVLNAIGRNLNCSGLGPRLSGGFIPGAVNTTGGKSTGQCVGLVGG